MKTKDVVFAYLDNIGVPSEVSFLNRFYAGFEELEPYWIGWHLDRDADALPQPKVMLGRQNPVLRGLDRVLFKTMGTLPPRPHLWHFRPRLIHAHFGRGGALALPLARAMKVPLFVTFHGGDATKEKHYRRGPIATIYQRRMVALQEYAAGFHCVSDYIRDTLLRRGFPPEKLFVVRTGVEPSSGEPALLPFSEPYVLFVGRLVEKKGVTHLIEAMARLQERGKSIPLVVIGDGPLAESLRRQADRLTQVRFLGWQPNAEVRRWMRGAMTVCVPSLMAGTGDSEGLGHVIMEAMEAGAPVVASRHGGIGEVVEDGATGLLVPAGDAGAIADALETLASNPELRRTYGLAARAAAQQKFDAATQSRALEARFLSMLKPVP